MWGTRIAMKLVTHRYQGSKSPLPLFFISVAMSFTSKSLVIGVMADDACGGGGITAPHGCVGATCVVPHGVCGGSVADHGSWWVLEHQASRPEVAVGVLWSCGVSGVASVVLLGNGGDWKNGAVRL